jgi:hypothetical protein
VVAAALAATPETAGRVQINLVPAAVVLVAEIPARTTATPVVVLEFLGKVATGLRRLVAVLVAAAAVATRVVLTVADRPEIQ